MHSVYMQQRSAITMRGCVQGKAHNSNTHPVMALPMCSTKHTSWLYLEQHYTDDYGLMQDKAHKTALQRMLRADAFALEHKRVNDWDLSDAMATFANQYRQELRSVTLACVILLHGFCATCPKDCCARCAMPTFAPSRFTSSGSGQ